MTRIRIDGPKVKAMIKAQGLKQWYIADRAGMSTGHLSNVLSRSNARLPTIQAIAGALRVRWQDIVTECESEEARQ